MLSVSGNLSHWYGSAIVTHQHLLYIFEGLLGVIVAWSFLSWPLLGLGCTLFLIGQRRRKFARDLALTSSEGQLSPPPARMDRVLNTLAWIFSAGTVGMGCWILYFLIMLGQFPSLYTPVALHWGVPGYLGESDADWQKSREVLNQTIKRCVLKFAPQDAQGPGNSVTFRFMGWFIDTDKADRIDACITAAGYSSTAPLP